MKILPCKYIFCKPEKTLCYCCREIGNNKYCYGILNIFRELKYLSIKIINYIKNIFDNRDIPF